MKKISLFIITSLLLAETGFGASRQRLPEAVQDSTAGTLAIGDRVPDVTLPKVLNYEGETVKLSGFRGKLVILDFWSVGCAPCIQSMPKMQALQDKFQDRLQVILVTRDSEDQVKKLFGRVKLLKNVRLPTVVNDTVLGPLFPFRLVPTHVWISEKGEVLQVTSGANTVEEKVEDYFEGKEVDLPVTNQHKDFDFKTPLWLEGGGRQLKYMQYYSYIMEYTPDAGGLTGVNKDPGSGKNVRVVATNQTLMRLCVMAYGGSMGSFSNPFSQNSRVILDVKDTSRFFYPKHTSGRDEWKRKNLYCYELVVSPDRSGKLFEFMQQDIARFFNITGRIEKRKMNCLVLKRTTDDDKLATNGGAFRYSLNYGEALNLRNLSMEWLLNMLHTYFGDLPTPIIDETEYTGNIDIDIEAKLNDLKAVKKELKRYGLDLVEEEREIEVLVLTEGNQVDDSKE